VKSPNKKTFIERFKSREILPLVIVVGLASAGVYLLFTSLAATPYSSVSATVGTLVGNASKYSDSKASGGSAVRFGSMTTAASNFVAVCGLQLCLNGQPFYIHGATAYGTYSEPSTEVALAQSGKINVLEMVEFDNSYHSLSDTESSATWNRADQFIADAKTAGIHIILNLSEYGQSLQASGQTPTTTDWNNYLSFIANRTNTVTGVQYKNDPTIAMVEIFGEICYIKESDSTCPAGTTGTTSQMQTFFDRTEKEWHTLAPNIMISSGGFSHLDSKDSPPGTSNGIPYQAIYSDSANSVCDIEVNSINDYNISIPKVTNYCESIGKPWFLSAWSSCYQDNGYPYYLSSDQAMASHTQDMYNLVGGKSPSTQAGVGSDFWNLNNTGVKANSCDLSPAYPLTWSAIQANDSY
jgi:hypothetical protein